MTGKLSQTEKNLATCGMQYDYLIIIATIVISILYTNVLFNYGMNSDDVGLVYSISYLLSGKSNFTATNIGFTNLSHYLGYFLFGESLNTLYVATAIEVTILIFGRIWISASTANNQFKLIGICIL